MRRYASLLALVVFGCAKKPEESVVQVPTARTTPATQPASSSVPKAVEKTVEQGAGAVPRRAPRTVANRAAPTVPSKEVAPQRSVAEAAPHSISPPPEIPKADETSRLAYRTPGGNAIDVAGVCRFDESIVSCWDAEGRSAPDVQGLVQAALASRDNENGVAVRYGKKNRILVVRQTTVPIVNGQGERRNISLQSVGPDPRYGSGYLNIRESPSWEAGRPQVRHEARVFAVDKDAHDTTMRLMVSEPMEKEADLVLKPGASASLNGVTFRIVSIGRAAPEDYGWMDGRSAPKMWSVKVAVSGKPVRPASLYPHFRETVYADKAGKPISQKTYAEWQRRRMESFRSPPPRDDRPKDEPYHSAFPNMRTTMRGRGEETEIMMSVDPTALGRLVLGGNYLRTVDIQGIPLDPL